MGLFFRRHLPFVLASIAILVAIILGAMLLLNTLQTLNNSRPSSASHVSHTSTAPGSCTAESPYGFTLYDNNHATDMQRVRAVLKDLHVCWIRLQISWYLIEKTQGNYDWSSLDAAVSLFNKAGVHVEFALQDPPDWRKTLICPVDGKPYAAGPNDMAQFATQVATRYSGRQGSMGRIDVIDVGNEEYDSYWTGNMNTTEQCRSVSLYGPVLEAGYRAIKAVDPSIRVATEGQLWDFAPHIRNWWSDLFQSYSSSFDIATAHYYHSTEDPAQTDAATEDPDFTTYTQIFHQIESEKGANKPLWITEFGWATFQPSWGGTVTTVSPDKQQQYMQYMYATAKSSRGTIDKLFAYTIGFPQDPHALDIRPNGQPLPAYLFLKRFIQDNPSWN